MTLSVGQNNFHRRAFTLIELILILALLVIVTSLVAPAMSNFIRGRAIGAEARRIFSLTHAAQSRAVSEGVPIMVWVNEKENSYGIEQETPAKDGDAKAEVLQVDDTLRLSVVSVAGTGAPTTFKSLPAIRFLADGTVDENSPQTLRLTHENGGELWLIESRNHMGYEISDKEKL